MIQTEADLMRLEEVHSALLIEHKNLQGDYGTLHGYVEASFSLLNNAPNYLCNLVHYPKETILFLTRSYYAIHFKKYQIKFLNYAFSGFRGQTGE